MAVFRFPFVMALAVAANLVHCSETTLTGESWFHSSTPLGIEPGSLMTGSKWVDYWTIGTMYECSEIAGSPQGSPQQPNMSVVKSEGGPAASVKPGQKSCVRSSGIITLSARQPSDGSGWSPPETRPQWSIMSGHQCSETKLTGESRFHKSTPIGIEPGSLMMGSKWVAGPVELCMNAVRLQALHISNICIVLWEAAVLK
jgi:hypothetical protein